MDMTQDEFNQEAIKYLKEIITGIEEGKINASSFHNNSEFSYGSVLDKNVWIEQDIPTGYHNFCIRYVEV